MTAAQPMFGTTLYSFTNEWVMGQYTLPQLLEVVAEAGIGPGLEFVGFQSIRNFPKVDSAFVTEFRDTMERLKLVPTSLAANIDIAIRPDRDLNTDERVAYIVPQLEVAKELGFPVVRIQIGADAATLVQLADHAERLDLRLGMEIHAPEGPETPKVMGIREVYEKIGSDRLGFIPDFSSTMHRITQGLVETFIDAGLPRDLTDDLQRIWAKDGTQAERLTEFLELAKSKGVADDAAHSVAAAFTMNGHEDPTSWVELSPRIFHVHAKFYEIDDEGNEPSIDHWKILASLREANYTGSISSEWEAHSWTPNADLKTAELIRRHHDLMRRAWAAGA